MHDIILLIDDDTVFVQSLARSLQRKGLHALTAVDARQALSIVANEKVERVVLDLNLNGESGLQVLQKLLQAQPGLRIIMLTAYASVATAVDAIKRGAINYLCKPVTANELLAAFSEEESQPTTAPEALEAVSLDRLEWEHIQRLLVEHQGNISATARALNMHRRTLQRKLQKRPVTR